MKTMKMKIGPNTQEILCFFVQKVLTLFVYAQCLIRNCVTSQVTKLYPTQLLLMVKYAEL